MTDRRNELMDACLAYFLAHGVANLSLRPLGEAVGSSARLLIYHFGSKEGLITAVMEEIQARVQASFSVAADKAASDAGPMAVFWAWTTHPDNLPYARLLYEIQVLALRNPEAYGAYLEGSSSGWMALILASMPPSPEALSKATLCAALIDGLLLEFLATGDLRRTTAALELFSRLLQSQPSPPATTHKKRERR